MNLDLNACGGGEKKKKRGTAIFTMGEKNALRWKKKVGYTFASGKEAARSLSKKRGDFGNDELGGGPAPLLEKKKGSISRISLIQKRTARRKKAK